MPPNSPHGSRWTGLGLACLLTLQAQWPGAHAQVAEIEKASNDSLLWGPYKPNLYFGVRPRIPKSLTGGLLWTRVEDYQNVQNSEYSSSSSSSTRHGSASNGSTDTPEVNSTATAGTDPMQLSGTRASSTSSMATAGTNTTCAAAAARRSTTRPIAST
jgi:hypothetical protein